MKNYKRSICATCRHAPYCSLTTDMSAIYSCSEYIHHLDEEETIPLLVSVEMSSTNAIENQHKEIVLN